MKLPLSLIIFIIPINIYSQILPIDIKLETNNDSITFIDFVNKLEKEKQLRFFYKNEWIDSITIKQTHTPIYLSKLLNDTFENTAINYLIDGSNIILTYNYNINAHLPEDFFDINSDIPDTNITNTLNYSFLKKQENKDTDKINSTINIGDPYKLNSKTSFILSGIIRNIEDGEPIVGAQVYIPKLAKGTTTDVYGYYLLNLPKGNHDILFKCLGREESTFPIMLYGDGIFNVNMKKSNVQISEVVIKSDKQNNLKNMNIGVQQLNVDQMKQLPATFGEIDIIKTALLLPGVQTVGEGASGFNVRGGSTDQNLILLDDAPIFNSSHFFGFFSVFNAETIKDFKLYKSGIPASYGGRIASVFDVKAKQGNLKKYSVSGGISPITGKITLEGPIIKDKLSFIIGGRSTYSDWILKKIDRPEFKNSTAKFNDLSLKLSYEINTKNSIGFTAYTSDDYFKLNTYTDYNYNNKCGRLFYKYFFNPKFYGKVSAIYSNYNYQISNDENIQTAYNMRYNIDYKSLKTNFSYFPNTSHTINFGSEVTRYRMTPGDYTPLNELSDIKTLKLPKENGLESSLFISDDYNINSRLKVSLGLRYTSFLILGPSKVYDYVPNVPHSIDTRIDSTNYSRNKIAKDYSGLDLRFSARYILGPNNSIKFSYNSLHQFVQMLTNSTAISPTDVWKLSDANIKPLTGSQIAMGYYHNICNNTIEISSEVYYKWTKNNLDYKSGAELLLNEDLELDILSGRGRAYGFELLIKKKSGRLNGWISYTYSKSELKIDSEYKSERINEGQFYPSNYDKPHNLNVVANYKYSRRFNLTNTLSYSTGRPITYPVAKYTFREKQLIHYSNRNEYRLPNYLRWDIAFNINENMKANKLVHNSWSIGVYNVLGIHNAYSVFFKSTSKGIKGYRLSIFAQPIVNVTYNFKF